MYRAKRKSLQFTPADSGTDSVSAEAGKASVSEIRIGPKVTLANRIWSLQMCRDVCDRDSNCFVSFMARGSKCDRVVKILRKISWDLLSSITPLFSYVFR